MISTVFRAIAIVAGGVWLGGMIVIGAIVAPTTFGVMRTLDVDHPNALAGQIMARNFARFDNVQLTCAAILLAWQILHMIAGGKTRRDWFRLALIVAAAGLLAYSVGVITPRILDLQPALTAADPEAAMRAHFDEIHNSAVRVAQAILFCVFVVVMEMTIPMNARPPKPKTPDRPERGA